MKYLAREHKRDHPLAASFSHKNFYVDDGLISVDSVQKAKQLVIQAQEICAKGNLNHSDIPMQTVLGVKWDVEADLLSFNVILKEKPAT